MLASLLLHYPIIESLAENFYGLGSTGAIPIQAESMYWALAMGACFGGNLTPVGAAANLVVINIAERNNKEISWGKYLKWGLPTAFWILITRDWIYLLICIFSPSILKIALLRNWVSIICRSNFHPLI